MRPEFDMPIPAFNIDGVIPPFIGPHGPGGLAEDLSPYEANSVEVVRNFSTTQRRCQILQGWLDHRSALRAIGIAAGFQWLDGSFVESKDPNDLDLVTFFRRPIPAITTPQIIQLATQNATLFRRRDVRATYSLDAMFVDLDGTLDVIVDQARYWVGLFSHRRNDFLWKGMIKVSLVDNGSDAQASAVLAVRTAALAAQVIVP